MGKGQIISGGTDGQYQVQLTLHRLRITETIARINDNIDQIDTLITAAIAEVTAQEEGINTLQIQINAIDPIADKTALENALGQMEGKIITLHALESKRDVLILKKTGMLKRIEYINNNMPVDPTISAWCADLTENLTGEVATIEIPGERGTVQIRPGYSGRAVFSAARDGQLQPSIAGTPEAVFYNLALLPGWQKWKPTYRTGTITFLNGDTCSVALDTATSSAQGLNVNQSSILTGVAIEYMD